MSGLLKFITCGSVDDGKSTLIGHILYDSKLLYADQEKALLLESKVGSRAGDIDYSLLLDGLMAEREQGITIDVAYRYFTTNRRSFIVADTPGHEEYTRNMAVGASFAELAIILMDATQGVLVQTRRHARICKMMGIQHFVFAVNKMDLAGYDEVRFNEILAEVQSLVEELQLDDVVVIPVSATEGDNVTVRSENMSWYKGPVLLEHLETVEIQEDDGNKAFCLPVQRVSRPSHEFRGFQGQIEYGTVSVGDKVYALPSSESANVKRILVAGEEAESAEAGQPVTIQLNREVDVSRGSVLSGTDTLKAVRHVTANLLWMDDQPLTIGKEYLMKVGTRKIAAVVEDIEYQTDVNTGEKLPARQVEKNGIANCKLEFADKVIVDTFDKNKALGALILIDRVSHMTAACGVIEELHEEEEGRPDRLHGLNGFNTTVLHGTENNDAFGATLTPIYQSSAFAQKSAEDIEKVFTNRANGFVYSRINNPTVEAFERKITKLEGGVASVACASGQAAVVNSILNIVRAGDEIISSAGLYGGTVELFDELKNYGITVHYVEKNTTEAFEPLFNEKTRLVFAETIGNPKLDVTDIAALAGLAHAHGVPLIIDNTVATPYLVKPLELGADIVVHSSSKYINGNSDGVSGIITWGGKFKWDMDKYPGLKEFRKFGPFSYVAKLRNGLFRSFGACLSPQNAYLNNLGLETLGLRMERSCSNALALARYLNSLEKDIQVNYLGLENSEYHELARTQFGDAYGALITLRLGSKEKAFELINALKLALIVSNIGDTKTLVLHPASTIAAHLSKEEREQSGVFDDTVRISVGIEDINDLKEDFRQALEQVL